MCLQQEAFVWKAWYVPKRLSYSEDVLTTSVLITINDCMSKGTEDYLQPAQLWCKHLHGRFCTASELLVTYMRHNKRLIISHLYIVDSQRFTFQPQHRDLCELIYTRLE